MEVNGSVIASSKMLPLLMPKDVSVFSLLVRRPGVGYTAASATAGRGDRGKEGNAKEGAGGLHGMMADFMASASSAAGHEQEHINI